MSGTSLRAQAYETIRGWIAGGRLAKGAVTSEVQLSRDLDMSRTPVRSALQQLELEGYVRIVPKHGVIVLDSSSQRVGDLLELIASMAMFAASQLQRSPHRSDLTALAQRHEDRCRRLLDDAGADGQAYAAFERELLSELVKLGGNAEMEQLLRTSMDRLFWTRNERRWHSPHAVSTRAELAALVQALREDGDGVALRDALFDYLHKLKRTWT